MTLQSLIKLFERDLDRLKNEIEQYSSDDKLWIVKEGITNSGGNLCAHLCGNLRHFIGAVLGRDGYVRDRHNEFTVKGLSKANLLAEIQVTRKAVSDSLAKLTDDDLNQDYPSKSPLPNSTTNETLIHLYGHLNYHLGQINYHRRLLG